MSSKTEAIRHFIGPNRYESCMTIDEKIQHPELKLGNFRLVDIDLDTYMYIIPERLVYGTDLFIAYQDYGLYNFVKDQLFYNCQRHKGPKFVYDFPEMQAVLQGYHGNHLRSQKTKSAMENAKENVITDREGVIDHWDIMVENEKGHLLKLHKRFNIYENPV